MRYTLRDAIILERLMSLQRHPQCPLAGGRDGILSVRSVVSNSIHTAAGREIE